MNGIQKTIISSFQDVESFTLKEAVNEVNSRLHVKNASIRARIYEGIEKGIFEKVDRGVYRVEKDGKSCVCILGDGRNLANISDGSIDAVVTDHPYEDKKAHKGGNRNFASSYECFRYSEEDFVEKARILKDGGFLCEFLPDESETNFEYLYDIKKMAEAAGLNYYATVPWKKGKFVANTGRKAKAFEQIVIFTKGKARALRPNVKQDLADPSVRHYMSGTAKMLPIMFDFDPPSKRERTHQAEKPVELLIELLSYITLPGDTVIDQFAGSGNLGRAALRSGRNSILFEKDEGIYTRMKKNIEKELLIN